MRPKIVLPLLLAGLALAAIAVAGGIVWFTLTGEIERLWPRLVPAAGLGLLVLAGLFAVVWLLISEGLIAPLSGLARDIETLTHTTQSRPPLLPKYHMLPELARAVDGLVQELDATRRTTRQAAAAAAARAESDKSRLEAILMDLAEGVIVCSRQHGILLYNQAAARILNSPEALGLGRVVFGVISRMPLLHALDMLLQRRTQHDLQSLSPARFVCFDAHHDRLLQTRLGLVSETDGTPTGYVLTFSEAAAAPWPLADMLSIDLFQALAGRLKRDGIDLIPVGVPRWLCADGHGLLILLRHLARRIASHSDMNAMDIAAVQDGDGVFIDLTWDGAPPDTKTLDAWLDTADDGTGTNRTRALAGRQGGIACGRVDGRARLRLPVHPPAQQAPEPDRHLPPRPEFYDFDLFHARPDETLLHTPLSKLHCVVFDTETTGLRPAQGDEIVSIGAVRVVNGRVLTGETFDRLVDPGRYIPKSSIEFHGITQEMVADAPPASVVLPQFKAFAGRSVLVAHNAAFDLKFLAMKERESGVAFDNAVLDVLLLSAFLHDHAKDHSLEAIAERLSVQITGRHTALGDAMATAAIFVAMIGPLQARGVLTLADALEASSKMVELRGMQAEF